jgi:hypothetical protein
LQVAGIESFVAKEYRLVVVSGQLVGENADFIFLIYPVAQTSSATSNLQSASFYLETV